MLDEPEQKDPEVTFKYYLPMHQTEMLIHVNAGKMYSLLWEIDQRMRSVLKYESGSEDRDKLAEQIRDMISREISLDELSH